MKRIFMFVILGLGLGFAVVSTTACSSQVDLEVANSVAQTSDNGGTILYSNRIDDNAVMVTVCRPNGEVNMLTVSGPASKPVVSGSRTIEATCGHGHKVMATYEKVMGTNGYRRKDTEEAMGTLEKALGPLQ